MYDAGKGCGLLAKLYIDIDKYSRRMPEIRR